MKRFMIAATTLIAAQGGALAASVTNLDAVEHVLVVTEGGTQTEIPIAPGQTIEFCLEGCFVQMPNGDREALTGTETLEIEASRGHVF
jgi:hypothetical protein